MFLYFRSDARSNELGEPPTGTHGDDEDEEEEEILGSDDDEQEDPKDYVKGTVFGHTILLRILSQCHNILKYVVVMFT